MNVPSVNTFPLNWLEECKTEECKANEFKQGEAVPYFGYLLQASEITLSRPFDNIKSVSLIEDECFTLEKIKSLAIRNFKRNYPYYFAVIRDKGGFYRTFDGPSLINNFFAHGQTSNPLNRQSIEKANFYVIKSSGAATAEYFCSLEDMLNIQAKNPGEVNKNIHAELYKSCICAASVSEGSSVGLLGEDQARVGYILEQQKSIKEAALWYSRAAQNHSWFAILRLLEIGPDLPEKELFENLTKALKYCSKSYAEKKEEYQQLLKQHGNEAKNHPLVIKLKERILQTEEGLGLIFSHIAIFYLLITNEIEKAGKAFKQASNYLSAQEFEMMINRLPDHLINNIGLINNSSNKN